MNTEQLVWIRDTKERKSGCILAIYKCFCGNVAKLKKAEVHSGHTKSCGCLRQKHGLTETPEYGVWRGMKKRCYLKTNPNYRLYGARGIKICNGWLNSFSIFFKDMGPRPSKGYSIERIDNNKGYYKENCKWATQKEQGNNQRTNRILEYKGKKLTQRQWSEKLEIKETCISERRRRGWTVEETLTLPLGVNRKLIEYQGEKKTLCDWCKQLDVKPTTVKGRLNKGLTIEEAFELPLQRGVKL